MAKQGIQYYTALSVSKIEERDKSSIQSSALVLKVRLPLFVHVPRCNFTPHLTIPYVYSSIDFLCITTCATAIGAQAIPMPIITPVQLPNVGRIYAHQQDEDKNADHW